MTGPLKHSFYYEHKMAQCRCGWEKPASSKLNAEELYRQHKEESGGESEKN